MASSATVHTFLETLRIIENAYKQDFEKVSEDANQLADKFERAGDKAKAERIRNKVRRFKQSKKAGSLMNSNNAEFDLYLPEDSKLKCVNFIPTKQNEVIINEIITIFHKKEAFWEAEIPLPNKTLMFGPPGTGKTISAHYISSKLDLPLMIVRLDSIITSALGGTASKIRKVFDVANKQPCVLFLDEFDAIAADRKHLSGNGAESEMRRVVNSLLQNMDTLNDDVMLFAATNLDASIDSAVWRRFHNRMDYAPPSEEEILVYLQKQIDNNFLVYEAAPTFIGYSFADIEMVINKAKTKGILRSLPLSKELIDEAINEHLLKGKQGQRERVAI
ncbi:ATP-binding protein [Bacillus badius]|uniref:AAA family ATPase n=1 Tax=Bacillus badius TaxID=1455 RepID=UPI001CBDA5D9|nr:ATP-binding protein [Bacillus badius]UAT31938.1 ATP-binding protein [Bacillus badius]